MVPLLAASLMLALVAPVTGAATPAATRDDTFFVLSDVHVGAHKDKDKTALTPDQMVVSARARLEAMRSLVGLPYPDRPALAGLQLGVVATPRGLFVLGDLTDGDKELSVRQEQWAGFDRVFPALGLQFGPAKVPVFACTGNHDGAPDGPARTGLVGRNRQLAEAGQLDAISTNGVHFALNWNGVHFVSLGLCPADAPDAETPFKFGPAGPGSWNDPQGALSFLRDYLVKHVGASGEPVVLMHHYGFDGFSLNDWNWWTLKQRRALYELLKDYNVVAILHGHDHHTAHYQWPDPQRHAADLAYFYEGKVPDHPRRYDVFSCGSVCWVMRIHGDQFIAAHFDESGWSKDPADFFVKSIKPGGRLSKE
jgi:3',5'-cyclic AMP phosphodiesterase CpdA